jgi:hypothetical protein
MSPDATCQVARAQSAASAATNPILYSSTFHLARHDKNVSYGGVRRKGMHDLSYTLSSNQTIIILDAIPRSGLSVSPQNLMCEMPAH